MPYSDDYTTRGAPDSARKPFDLPPDHPFSGYPERELTKINMALTLVRASMIQLGSAIRGIPLSDIRDPLEGFTSELRDYLDKVDSQLDEAFASFGE
jgi:hypothetical protein